jgi:V/A-type H+-transporting ATPase subunit I
MRQMIAAVDIEYYDEVTKALLKSGAMHFIKIRRLRESYDKKIDPISPHTNEAELAAVRRRIESLCKLIKVEPAKTVKLDVDDFESPQTDEASKTADALSGKIEEIRERQRQIQQELMRLYDVYNQIDRQKSLPPDLMQEDSRFLTFLTGRIPAERRDEFAEDAEKVPAVPIPLELETGGEFVVIVLKRNEAALHKVLESYGWQKLDLQDEEVAVHEGNRMQIRKRIDALEEEQKTLRESVEDTVREEQDTLLEFWKNLRLNELYNTIEKNYGKTAHTVLFTGWVPRSLQESLDSTIRKACKNACYIEWHRPEDAVGIEGHEAPVQFKNPKVLRPFQMLVENYSIPEYGTFDPTPVVAVAYLIMFGMMFGDAGHGAVLVLAGVIGSIVRRDSPIKRLFQLIVWCGASAVVFGVLFGSYFGMEWLPPVWFDFHGAVTGHGGGGFVNDIYGILTLTIYFGIGVIGIGLLINWANCIRKGRWMQLVLDKTGILGGWMYGAGVYTAFYFGKHDFKQLPPGSLLFWILGIPAILFFLKPIVEFVIEHRRHGKPFTGFTVVDFIMEWIVEMLEVFSGYLANTLSFMRVAGLGIAHVSLMTAFFEIGRMIGNGSYNIGSYIVLLFGNLLVIVLEGLSAGIQSLRLNYYEFFSKYFSGSGIAYTPVSLKRPQFGG